MTLKQKDTQGKYRRVEIKPGHRFNQLIVISESKPFIQPGGQKQRAFLCKCDCGNLATIRLSHLNHGRVKSCGCLSGEKHKETESKLYNVWRGMKNRCNGKKYPERHLYGGRGIRVCYEWEKSYILFRNWALRNGFEPGLTIDRIDNNGNYEPGNCRFVSQLINTNNRRDTFYVNYDGQKTSFMLLLRQKNLLQHIGAIRCRIARGWDVKKAIDTPIRKGNYKRKYTVV